MFLIGQENKIIMKLFFLFPNQDGIHSQSNREFDENKIKDYNRKYCYECRIPKAKSIDRFFETKHYKTPQADIYNPFEEKFVPPLSCLQKWREELDRAKKIAKDFFYIESSMGRFDLTSIQNSVSMLSVANTKKAVIQEIEWFN